MKKKNSKGNFALFWTRSKFHRIINLEQALLEGKSLTFFFAQSNDKYYFTFFSHFILFFPQFLFLSPFLVPSLSFLSFQSFPTHFSLYLNLHLSLSFFLVPSHLFCFYLFLSFPIPNSPFPLISIYLSLSFFSLFVLFLSIFSLIFLTLPPSLFRVPSHSFIYFSFCSCFSLFLPTIFQCAIFCYFFILFLTLIVNFQLH